VQPRIWGAETPKPIATNFCMSDAVHDVITHANFCEDYLRGFDVARGRILGFSMDLICRLFCDAVSKRQRCAYSAQLMLSTDLSDRCPSVNVIDLEMWRVFGRKRWLLIQFSVTL